MLSLRFLLAVLWQQRLAFITTFVAIAVGAAALIWSTPHLFVAESLIAVDNRPFRSALGAVSGQEASGSTARVEPALLVGEVNILGSRAIVEQVVRDTGLEADPEFAAAGSLFRPVLTASIRLLHAIGGPNLALTPVSKSSREDVAKRVSKALTIEVPRGSSQIRVSFRSVDAAKAATVVNALVAIYLEEQAGAKQRVAQRTLAELQESLERLRREVEVAGQAVQSFREKNTLLKTAGPSPLAQQLSELVVAEQRSRLEAQDAAARLELLRSMETRAAEAAALVSGANQESLSRLAAQEADLRARLARDSSALGDTHPAVAELRGQLKQIGERLAALHLLATTVLANEAAALNGRHQRLAESLQSVRSEIGRENALDSRLEQLSSEARAKQVVFEEFLASYNRTQMLERSAVPDMRVVHPAQPLGLTPVSKLPLLAVSLPLAALMASLTVALLHKVTSSRRQTAREFEEWNGVPIIGICPAINGLPRSKDPAGYLGRSPLSDYAEAVRGVRNAVDFDLRKAVTVAVTSASIGEGKSTLAISLATAWASAGARTLLVDCDMRRPALPNMLECTESHGLTDILNANSAERRVIQTDVRLGFDFITAGSQLSEASYRFTRHAMRTLIDEFTPMYDRIILDLPPVLAVSDGAVGAAASDLVLFVNHWGQTKPDDTRMALELLRKLGATEIRAVLCRVDRRRYAKLYSVNQHSRYAQAGRYNFHADA